MKTFNFILALFVFFIFIAASSCSLNNNVEEVIEGWWTMDTIYFKGFDIKRCLLDNSLLFKKDNQIVIPVAGKYCKTVVNNGFSEKGNWKITKLENVKDTIPLRMKIITENEVFSGIHKIVFYKDKLNKLLKMEIFSDSLYIVCRKGLYDFDNNIKIIDELEKISWTTRPN